MENNNISVSNLSVLNGINQPAKSVEAPISNDSVVVRLKNTLSGVDRQY